MAVIARLWKKFKSQPDVWFFYAFLATFTLSIRKVLFFYQIDGSFNEYSGTYLYVSDIFLFFSLVSWSFLSLNNKSLKLSIKDLTRGKFKKKKDLAFYLLPLSLVTWSFFSIGWSDNALIAWFSSIKLLELFLLYVYIANVSRETFKHMLEIIIALGLIQSILGVWQVLIQHSIGLFWLKESLISPNIDGVAKVILRNQKYIRAYGLFPHPNILGGFLLFSLVVSLYYFNVFRFKNTKKVPRGIKSFLISRRVFLMIVGVQALGLLVSVSKSAIFGFLIAAGFIIFSLRVPRGTIVARIRFVFNSLRSGKKVPHGTNKSYLKKASLVFLIIFFLIIILKPNAYSLFIKSLNERLLYLNVSRGTILSNMFLGVGSGQFVWNMSKYVPRGTYLLDWQFQPVHNVFLLIWSELGLIGLILVVWWLRKMFHVEQNDETKLKCEVMNVNGQCEVYEPVENVLSGAVLNERAVMMGILLGFIFVMFFDHYLWDIQQGEIMLWIVLGMAVNLSIDKK